MTTLTTSEIHNYHYNMERISYLRMRWLEKFVDYEHLL